MSNLIDRVNRLELALGSNSNNSNNAGPLVERVARIQSQLSSLPFATASYANAIDSLRSTERAAVQSVAAPDIVAQATLVTAALDDVRAWSSHADTIASSQSFVNDEALSRLAALDLSSLTKSELELRDLQQLASAQTAALDELLQTHAAVADSLAEQFYLLDSQIALLEREKNRANKNRTTNDESSV